MVARHTEIKKNRYTFRNINTKKTKKCKRKNGKTKEIDFWHGVGINDNEYDKAAATSVEINITFNWYLKVAFNQNFDHSLPETVQCNTMPSSSLVWQRGKLCGFIFYWEKLLARIIRSQLAVELTLARRYQMRFPNSSKLSPNQQETDHSKRDWEKQIHTRHSCH